MSWVGTSKGAIRAICAVLLAAMLVSCEEEANIDLMDAAEKAWLDGNWTNAIPLLKRRLLEEPADPAAHFYLGRCYLVPENFWPLVAEGEFQTALRYFHKSGGRNPIPRFDNAAYFEMMCNIESAKALLRQIEAFLSMGAKLGHMSELVQRCGTYIQEAKRIMPEAQEVRDMERLFMMLDAERPAPRFEGSSVGVNTV